MLDLKFVRENLDALRDRLALRGMDVDLAPFQALEAERRSLILEIDELRARRNVVSKEIAAQEEARRGRRGRHGRDARGRRPHPAARGAPARERRGAASS